jgi:hypothetical protein
MQRYQRASVERMDSVAEGTINGEAGHGIVIGTPHVGILDRSSFQNTTLDDEKEKNCGNNSDLLTSIGVVTSCCIGQCNITDLH